MNDFKPKLKNKIKKISFYFKRSILDSLIDEVATKVMATCVTMPAIYPFGMVVNALSDIHKKPEWDSQIEGLQVFQNFATNGFIYRTCYT